MKKITYKVSYFFKKFQIVSNKSRQSCFFAAILGLIKSGKVQLPSIAEAMKESRDTIKVSSIIHRLEDFFREVQFNYDVVASLLLSFLDSREKIRLCIDRTEWKFGNTEINILMIMAYTSTTQVPVYWELLDNKSGNSNANDRIELLKKIVELVGIKHIGLIIGDREFIGHSWLKYLKTNNINFCMRVPKNHSIQNKEAEKSFITDFDFNTNATLYLKERMVDGVWVNVMVRKLDNDDFLFLIGNLDEPRYLGQVYRRRWKIEVLFQSFKGRGFDLESTHMKDFSRLKKLIAMVAIAYSICVSVGVINHEKVQKIKIKKHGYKSKSFCRAGIDFIKDICKLPSEIFNQIIEKFLRLLLIQKTKCKINIINNSLSTN